ncbi:MAG: pyridoxal phosphate-dependent aminotransferase [Ignavibacteriales bacterium]|nr:pyridoxal phosphate-dependent aminotransferase [Ignavibacteriales bacterium]
MQIANRTKNLGTEGAFEVLAKARALEAQGQNIIHLEIGEPDFDTPLYIRDAAKKALDTGYTHYLPSAGFQDLRLAIAEHISSTRNVPVNFDEVVITPGAKPILNFVLYSTINEGDEVINPNPAYPIYESLINFVGAKPVPYILKEEKGFRFDLDEVKSLVTKKTKMIILNTPHNPTGGILTESDLQGVADLAIKHDLMIFVDEIYDRIIYDGFKHKSILALPGMKERTILLNGFSKTYAMTGWRLGYGIMPKDLAMLVAKMQINCTSHATTFAQVAGVTGLRGPQDDVNKMVSEFWKRRDIIVDGLNKIPGVKCHKPLGAFYVFPNIKGTGTDSRMLADLIMKGGVACLPGTAFGSAGEGYLRFSYANSIPNIEEALRRVEKVIRSL